MTTHYNPSGSVRYSPAMHARRKARNQARRDAEKRAEQVALKAWWCWARNMQRWCKARGEGWEA